MTTTSSSQQEQARSPRRTKGVAVPANLLTENQIVDAVRAHLEASGWHIVSFCHSLQQGDDIVAERGGVELRIEAKGETSAVRNSARFGQPFNSGQAYDHVAKAVLRCLRWSSRGKGLGAIAVPYNDVHWQVVSEVMPALTRAGVRVFWVREDLTVEQAGDGLP